MQALADVDLDRGVIVVGVFLALKMFDVLVALLVDVIDDPGFSDLALAGFPATFANGHFKAADITSVP